METLLNIPATGKIVPREVRNAALSLQAKMNHHMVHSPSMSFDRSTDTLNVTGRSTSLFTSSTYTTLIDMIDNYLYKTGRFLGRFQYEMVNSSTVKALFELISVLNRRAKDGNEIVFEWILTDEEDDDLREVVEDLAFYADFPFIVTSTNSK